MIANRARREPRSNPADDRFIDDFAQAYGRYGLSLTWGRIFGLALMSEQALTLDEIAERLRISKSGASVAARELVRAGVLRRLATQGSRRIAYEATDDMEPLFLAMVMRIRDTLVVVEKGEALLSSGRAKKRMREMKELHEFWLRAGDEIIDRWRRRKPRK